MKGQCSKGRYPWNLRVLGFQPSYRYVLSTIWAMNLKPGISMQSVRFYI